VIPLTRLSEPLVLTESKARWQATYQQQRVKNSKARPSSAQYAHEEIVSVLESISSHKCFYCEQSTKQTKREVDHYIEVTERPDLAFEWTNLYLSCFDCNRGKLTNKSVPSVGCLDPCDPDVRPVDHLTFDDEYISFKSGSQRGPATIKKYGLDREDLDYKRLKQLRLFDKSLTRIHKAMIAEGRTMMSDPEKDLLRHFRQPDQPFSLMFVVYLARIDL
jgi:hypothetical protein